MYKSQYNNSYGFLKALIKKQDWDLSRLRGEANIAANAVLQLILNINTIENDIAKKTIELQQLQEPGQLLVPDHMDLIKNYIQYKSTKLVKKVKEKKQAEEVVKQLTEEYAKQKDRLRVMQDMLQTRESELMSDQARDITLEMDDLWAQRDLVS